LFLFHIHLFTILFPDTFSAPYTKPPPHTFRLLDLSLLRPILISKRISRPETSYLNTSVFCIYVRCSLSLFFCMKVSTLLADPLVPPPPHAMKSCRLLVRSSPPFCNIFSPLGPLPLLLGLLVSFGSTVLFSLSPSATRPSRFFRLFSPLPPCFLLSFFSQRPLFCSFPLVRHRTLIFPCFRTLIRPS